MGHNCSAREWDVRSGLMLTLSSSSFGPNFDLASQSPLQALIVQSAGHKVREQAGVMTGRRFQQRTISAQFALQTYMSRTPPALLLTA
eukprot:1158714-Pelagomonas_calceolata.AAC.9